MRLDVFLNHRGRRRYVGVLEEQGKDIFFEYHRTFLDSGIPFSPFKLPLQPGVFVDPQRMFDGLFGVFNDSLPDGWGLLLLDRFLRGQGLSAREITPLHRLAYVGTQGMGALEYEPPLPSPVCAAQKIDLDGVAEEARTLLEEAPLSTAAVGRLLCLNGSSGGARPKILVKVSPDKSTLLPDTAREPGYESWMVKFPARFDGRDIGRMEYACSLAARRAGIAMPETHLFEAENGDAYFGVKRFDRDGDTKIHVHTACGLLHASHRYSSLDYENLLKLTKILTGNVHDVERMVRLMIFNVKCGNKDDHTKNFSYLLEGENAWRLAPAYDVTPSEGLAGEQTCMVNGKGRNIRDRDLMAAADVVDVSPTTVREIIGAVEEALAEQGLQCWTSI